MNIQEVLLTKEARFNLLAGLIRLARCDEFIEQSELAFFQQAAISLELEPTYLERIDVCWNTKEHIDIKFETRKEKIFFFIQAIQLCWIDKEYGEKERKEVRMIAKELDLEMEVILAIEQWVYDGIVWNRQSDKLLEL